MLILEGADNLGKTYAAERILDRVGQIVPAFYAHMTRPVPAFDFSVDHYADRMSDYAIQDRFHLGALVWHKDEIEEPTLRSIEKLLDRYQSVTCIFYSTDPDYLTRLAESRREEMFSVEAILNANEIYKSIINGTHPLKPHWDIAIDLADGMMTLKQIEQIAYFWLERLQNIETPESTSTLSIRTGIPGPKVTDGDNLQA